MKIGVSSFAGSISELAKYVQSVELYIPKLNIYKNRTLDKESFNTILDQLSVTDLLTSIHAPYYTESETYPSALRVNTAQMTEKDFILMEESLMIASEIGSEVVVIHPGTIHGNREQTFNQMVENLKTLAKCAENLGIMIGLENKEGTAQDNLCCDVHELISAIVAVNSDNLKATFDIGHANLTCGGNSGSLKQFIHTLSPYIIHMHLHDNAGKWTDNYYGDQHLAPGKGIIDYTILKMIQNYNGIYNMEVFSIDDIIFGKDTLMKAFE